MNQFDILDVSYTIIFVISELVDAISAGSALSNRAASMADWVAAYRGGA